MNDMSLKAKIRNIASEKNVSAQSVLQNYLIPEMQEIYAKAYLEVNRN